MSVTARPQAQHEWDAVVRAWRDSRGHRFLRRYSDAVNADLLRRWLGGASAVRVLKTDLFDEAVGDGLYPVLRSLAPTVVGIDVSPDVAAAARSHYPDFEAEVADVRALPFADATFDAVVSNSTLDHFDSLADVRAGIAELRRVLRPAGLLVVTLDNPVNPLVALRNRLPFEPLNRLGLVPYFVGATCGPRKLGALLREEGFAIERMDAVMHFPRALARAAAAVARDAAEGNGLLRAVRTFERLQGTPVRYVTGQFVAALAVKLDADGRPT